MLHVSRSRPLHFWGAASLFLYLLLEKFERTKSNICDGFGTNQSSTIQRNGPYFSSKEPFIKYSVLLTSSFWRTQPIEMYRKTYQQQNNRKL